jgi:hypothetical protein
MRYSIFILVLQVYTISKVTYFYPFLLELLQHAENSTQDSAVSFVKMLFR